MPTIGIAGEHRVRETLQQGRVLANGIRKSGISGNSEERGLNSAENSDAIAEIDWSSPGSIEPCVVNSSFPASNTQPSAEPILTKTSSLYENKIASHRNFSSVAYARTASMMTARGSHRRGCFLLSNPPRPAITLGFHRRQFLFARSQSQIF
jgi:hypothetical protein